jgi:sec1 family domain-containing protein 1
MIDVSAIKTVASILEVFRSSKAESQPTASDKLRLVLIFYLSSPDNVISKDDIAELETELKKSGADIAAFEYVSRMRELSRMIAPSATGGSATPVLGGGGQGGELFKGFSSLGNRVRPVVLSNLPDTLMSSLLLSLQAVWERAASRISYRA